LAIVFILVSDPVGPAAPHIAYLQVTQLSFQLVFFCYTLWMRCNRSASSIDIYHFILFYFVSSRISHQL